MKLLTRLPYLLSLLSLCFTLHASSSHLLTSRVYSVSGVTPRHLDNVSIEAKAYVFVTDSKVKKLLFKIGESNFNIVREHLNDIYFHNSPKFRSSLEITYTPFPYRVWTLQLRCYDNNSEELMARFVFLQEGFVYSAINVPESRDFNYYRFYDGIRINNHESGLIKVIDRKFAERVTELKSRLNPLYAEMQEREAEYKKGAGKSSPVDPFRGNSTGQETINPESEGVDHRK